MLAFLKSLFGLGPKDAPAKASVRSEPGPMGLSLGLAATIDVNAYRLDEGSLPMGMPPSRIVITGHGVSALDGGGILHRFYDDDGRILQILCVDSLENVTEAMILVPWDSVVPQTDREWNSWEAPGGKMRGVTYDADGIEFERVWGEPTSRDVPPVEFTERVVADEGPVKRVHQKTMAFKRKLPNGNAENLLIISERDLASNDRGSIGFMLGYGLAVADVRPL